MHIFYRCNKVGYSQWTNLHCMQGEANATFLGLVAIVDDVTTKMKRCYYYSLPLQQILVMATQNSVIANGSVDVATHTRLLGMEAWILRRKPEALQCGNCIATI